MVITAAAARLFLRLRCARRQARQLWVFDTFEGIPAPTDADPDYQLAAPYTGSFRGIFGQRQRILLRTSWNPQSRDLSQRPVQDTVAKSETGPIAVFHLDGDW